VKQRWDEIKKNEKAEPQGLLDGVPRAQPALAEAAQISSKAAAAGFDWPEPRRRARQGPRGTRRTEAAPATAAEREAEFGDLLFTLVNVARFLKVDPEQALRGTNASSAMRFNWVEQELARRGRTVRESAAAEGIRELEVSGRKRNAGTKS
jgi:uncharacterized protein YabN with tetrapyrrole methylase and pyrophosphatase domain